MTKYKAVRGRIIRINSWILSWEHRGQKLSFESKRVGNDSTYSYMKQNEKPLTVMDIPSPSVLLFWITTVLGSPIPLLFLALLSESSSSSKACGSGGGGAGALLLGSLRPLHALITVLCLCRCISASIWFQSWSCSLPLMSRPSNWICCILWYEKNITFAF